MFMRGAGLVIIAAALAECSSSHPSAPDRVVIDVSRVIARGHRTA